MCREGRGGRRRQSQVRSGGGPAAPAQGPHVLLQAALGHVVLAVGQRGRGPALPPTQDSLHRSVAEPVDAGFRDAPYGEPRGMARGHQTRVLTPPSQGSMGRVADPRGCRRALDTVSFPPCGRHGP